MSIAAAARVPIHATLLAFGHPCPESDLFGVGGRELLARLELPEPRALWGARMLHTLLTSGD